MTLAPPDQESIAAEALAAMDDVCQIAPFSARYPGLSLDDAYRISARLCALRTARGECVIGRTVPGTVSQVSGHSTPLLGLSWETN